MAKLILENVSNKLVQAICSIYLIVKFCIRYQSSKSDVFSSHIGLKQGDPRSPLLFMLFISGIIQNVNSDFDNKFTIDELHIHVFMLIYADDAVVFARSLEVLQSILNYIDSYCTTWGLKITSFKYLGSHFFKKTVTGFEVKLNNS